MSFEVYLQVFVDGRASGFSPAQVRHAFAGYLHEIEEDFWRVEFAPGQDCDLFLQPLAGAPDLVHSVSVHRPCADDRLWQAIFTLLAIPGAVFHFPGGDAPLVRDRAVKLPPDVVDALGAPQVAASPRDLRPAVA